VAYCTGCVDLLKKNMLKPTAKEISSQCDRDKAVSVSQADQGRITDLIYTIVDRRSLLVDV